MEHVDRNRIHNYIYKYTNMVFKILKKILIKLGKWLNKENFIFVVEFSI